MPFNCETSIPTRDFYLFSINPESASINDCNWIYITHNNKHYIKIDIYKNSNQFASLMVFGFPEAVIYQNTKFPRDLFLTIESKISLTTTSPIISNSSEINFKAKLEVFSDAAVISIGQKPLHGPYFLIHEKNKLAVLVDDQLVVNAIVLLNMTPDEMVELTKFHLQNIPITPYQEPKIELKELDPMENTKCLIQKIIELKNTNIWHVLYYAYQKTLIDNEFLIDYAIELLSQNKTNDPKIVELASLLDSEKQQTEKIFESFVLKEDQEKILYAESPAYNKIWFYLILAADMCAEKIIE